MKTIATVSLLIAMAFGTMAFEGCEIDFGKDMPHSGDADTATSPPA